MSDKSLSQVSSLYIVLPVLFVIFIIAMILRHRQNRLAGFSIADKIILGGMLVIYLILYSYLILLYRRPSNQPQINLNMFWSYREAFRFNDGIFRIRRLSLARQILLNILVMIPIGLLLPLVYHRCKHLYLLTLLTGLALSFLTEALQYFTHLGLCELDDILDNTLGCLLGVLLLHFGAWVTSRICRYRKANNPNN